jgi:uncharacterized protein (TIGR00251 family)
LPSPESTGRRNQNHRSYAEYRDYLDAVASARIGVRVQPRARRNEVASVREGVVVVRVTAPALEGRANRAVRRVVAERLGVPPGRVAIVRGERHRDKVLQVSGVEQQAADAALGLT